MLKEYGNVSQNEADRGIFRRWFYDDYFDLVVWYGDTREVVGFQLCYDRLRDPHAYTWYAKSGGGHNRIDTGPELHNLQTPILVKDGIFPMKMVSARFSEASRGIDPAVRELVIGVLAGAKGE